MAREVPDLKSPSMPQAALLCPPGRRVAPLPEEAAITVESRSLLTPAVLITPVHVPIDLDAHR